MGKSWADAAIDKLAGGESADIRPHGNSMKGKVESGQQVTVSPCDESGLAAGDMVLVRVKGRVYLHLVKAVREGKDGKRRFQIGNNCGGINGWVGAKAIYGKMEG